VGKLGPRPFLAAAAIFAAGILLIGVWMHFSKAEVDRILATGKRAKAVVTEKEIQESRRADTYWIRYDIEGLSSQYKQIPRHEWDKLKVGDSFTYYYDPAEPEFGLPEPQIEMSRDVSGVFVAGSFLVGPLLLAALILWLRRKPLKS
jgi:hypothetical protein